MRNWREHAQALVASIDGLLEGREDRILPEKMRKAYRDAKTALEDEPNFEAGFRR